LDSKTVIVGSTAIKVTISDSDSERIKGLSGSKELEQNQGMFFIFDQEDFHGIWMKDMNYPIDIIWFDKNKKSYRFCYKCRTFYLSNSFQATQKGFVCIGNEFWFY
jgi:uncharacterized membrane protein (UPF0127 family)